MKLSEFKKTGDAYTSKASEIIRQLTLGGVAIIWLFKEDKDGISSIDTFLLFPLFFLCLSLLFDLLQYVIGGAIWKSFYLEEEKKLLKILANNPALDKDPDIKTTKSRKKPIVFFYWAKIISMILAYIFIIVFILDKISFV